MRVNGGILYSSIHPWKTETDTMNHYQEKKPGLNPIDAEQKIFAGIQDITLSFLEAKLENNGPGLKEFLNDLEKTIIEYALAIANFNQKRVAGILGVKKTSLNEKLKRYRINAAQLNIDRRSLQNLHELAHQMIRNEINTMIMRHEK